MQKIEILISKQFVLRHHLSQYIVDERYVKNSNFYMNFDFKFQKLFDLALRFIYDVFRFDNISIFNQHQHFYTTYWNQIEQWNEKKRFLKTLFAAKFESWLKITSKIIWIKRFIMNDIEIHITNIFKSIVVQNFIIWIRHIDNVKLQQLWKLCDFEDYEIISEIMLQYLNSRKNEILIFKKSRVFNVYRRFAIEFFDYCLRFVNLR